MQYFRAYNLILMQKIISFIIKTIFILMLYIHLKSYSETKRCASAASLGQTLCLPNAPPAIGFSLPSSTNLSCSSQVIVSRQHGMARAPNPYRKQQSSDDCSRNDILFQDHFRMISIVFYMALKRVKLLYLQLSTVDQLGISLLLRFLVHPKHVRPFHQRYNLSMF